MLDESEFAVAVHLIQRRLCGFDIPVSIPNTWRPEPRPLLVIRQLNEQELQSYGTIFVWLLPNENGLQNRKSSLLILLLFHRMIFQVSWLRLTLLYLCHTCWNHEVVLIALLEILDLH